MIIAIEGIDGVGKTTLARALATKIGAFYLKFPDRETVSGKAIDRALRREQDGRPIEQLPPAAMQALQFVNRMEKRHLLTLAEKSTTRHVVCDRYTMSGLVYGMSDGLPIDWLIDMSLGTEPDADLQILLVADPEMIDRERLAGRDREIYENRGIAGLSAQSTEFECLWRAGYAMDPDIWRTLPVGERTPLELMETVAGIIAERAEQLRKALQRYTFEILKKRPM